MSELLDTWITGRPRLLQQSPGFYYTPFLFRISVFVQMCFQAKRFRCSLVQLDLIRCLRMKGKLKLLPSMKSIRLLKRRREESRLQRFDLFFQTCPSGLAIDCAILCRDVCLLNALIFRHMWSMRLRKDIMLMWTALDTQIMLKLAF